MRLMIFLILCKCRYSELCLFIHHITYRMFSIISTNKESIQTYRAIVIDDNGPMFTGSSNIVKSNPKAAMSAPQVNSQALEHTPLWVQVSKNIWIEIKDR